MNKALSPTGSGKIKEIYDNRCFQLRLIIKKEINHSFTQFIKHIVLNQLYNTGYNKNDKMVPFPKVNFNLEKTIDL